MSIQHTNPIQALIGSYTDVLFPRKDPTPANVFGWKLHDIFTESTSEQKAYRTSLPVIAKFLNLPETSKEEEIRIAAEQHLAMFSVRTY